MRCGRASKSSRCRPARRPPRSRRRRRTARAAGPRRLHQLGEVPGQRLLVAAAELHVVAVAEHDARGSRPTSARRAGRRRPRPVGDVPDGLGQHRGHRGITGRSIRPSNYDHAHEARCPHGGSGRGRRRGAPGASPPPASRPYFTRRVVTPTAPAGRRHGPRRRPGGRSRPPSPWQAHGRDDAPPDGTALVGRRRGPRPPRRGHRLGGRRRRAWSSASCSAVDAGHPRPGPARWNQYYVLGTPLSALGRPTRTSACRPRSVRCRPGSCRSTPPAPSGPRAAAARVRPAPCWSTAAAPPARSACARSRSLHRARPGRARADLPQRPRRAGRPGRPLPPGRHRVAGRRGRGAVGARPGRGGRRAGGLVDGRRDRPAAAGALALADRVRAVVLDAPVVDWRAVLDHHAGRQPPARSRGPDGALDAAARAGPAVRRGAASRSTCGGWTGSPAPPSCRPGPDDPQRRRRVRAERAVAVAGPRPTGRGDAGAVAPGPAHQGVEHRPRALGGRGRRRSCSRGWSGRRSGRVRAHPPGEQDVVRLDQVLQP